ncbi:hypothetical protein GCM10009809_21860 [Isoptericola hypogeus]|uniref:Uncharacterized protein n=1 Tax=Isoptericola hypogeus TaxID=300179 RepID=A0ABN2JI24_9MICO
MSGVPYLQTGHGTDAAALVTMRAFLAHPGVAQVTVAGHTRTRDRIVMREPTTGAHRMSQAGTAPNT